MSGRPRRAAAGPEEAGVRAALEAEQGFVRLLGGYTVGLPGGTLLVNERIPLGRFNVVQAVAVARGRRTQFFEAALDHYFQRALRPRFRVPLPVPEHVHETLSHLGFRPTARPEVWLLAGPERGAPPARHVRRVASAELEGLVGIWAGGRELLELRRQIEVGMDQPNPGEELAPFVMESSDGSVTSAGLAYRRGDCLDLEAVTTVVERRGRGAATGLVAGILGTPFADEVPFVALRSEEPRLAERLAPLGFRVAATSRVYELPKEADLTIRAPASTGPLWRPPRTPAP